MDRERRPYSMNDLLYLMQRLRHPEHGCPWDLDQDYKSITPSTLEEAFEVVDAIEREDYGHLKEELGDLLFQVVFYTQLADEEQRYTFEDVVDELTAKLVRRHPHVFPDGNLHTDIEESAKLKNSGDVKKQWEELKAQERKAKGKARILDDIPLALPALSRAHKMQKRIAKKGLDWPDLQGVFLKLAEEVEELQQAVDQDDSANIEEELGDLLFTAANISRYLGRDPEQMLRAANKKFETRVDKIEAALERESKTLDEISADEAEALWQKVKAEEAK